jgi:Putative amidoligase enzyme
VSVTACITLWLAYSSRFCRPIHGHQNLEPRAEIVDILYLGAVELRSPKLRTDEAPNWRSTVKKTWAFIERNYIVSKNEECSTHVHVSVISGGRAGRPEQIGMSLEIMKKIAQCVIHFEPALEVLVPHERRGNAYARSNWIDNNNFAQESSTREAVIRQIDGCTTEDELIMLMCPGHIERNFAFNFHAIKEFGTIEYRKGSASLNGDEAVAWADLALLFVQAAVQVKPESLCTVPANIKALKEFLGTTNLRNLQPLLGGKQPDESQQPKICSGESTGSRRDMLVRKLKADEEKQQRLAQQQ